MNGQARIPRDPDPEVHVVEGDPAVRDSLLTLLGLNGFRVHGYDRGEAFLEQLAEHRVEGNDWVICEAELPDTTGLDVFARIRAMEARIPFILLVSRSDPGTIRAARDAGVNRVLPKPLVHRHLIRALAKSRH